jgi:hypothetical protein
MKSQSLKKLDAAERSVQGVVQECSKQGPLYHHNPKTVAQVSRTGKWLLNAIASLRNVFTSNSAKETDS